MKALQQPCSNHLCPRMRKSFLCCEVLIFATISILQKQAIMLHFMGIKKEDQIIKKEDLVTTTNISPPKARGFISNKTILLKGMQPIPHKLTMLPKVHHQGVRSAKKLVMMLSSAGIVLTKPTKNLKFLKLLQLLLSMMAMMMCG